MALSIFKKPKWKHSDPNIRLAAVQEIDERDTETLRSLVLHDEDESVRLAALDRIDDREVLEGIAQQIDDVNVARVVREKINRLLFESVISGKDLSAQKEVVARISDPDLLSRLAVEAEDPEIRVLAINRINDEKALGQILKQECGREAAIAALEKITNQELLQHIAEKGGSKKIRNLAAQKIAPQEPEPVSGREQDKSSDDELDQIASTAERLADSQSWDLAKGRFEELSRTWQGLDPQGIHPLKPSFDKARERFEQRFAEEQQRRAAAQQQQEEKDRLLSAGEKIYDKLHKLVGSLEPDVKQRFEELQAQWPIGEDVADKELVELSQRYRALCRNFLKNLEAAQVEGKFLAELVDLCGQAEELTGKDVEQAGKLFHQIRARFFPDKFSFVDVNEFERRLNAAEQNWQEVKKSVDQARYQESKEKCEQLCRELESLLDADNRLKAEKQIKKIKNAWQKLSLSARSVQEQYNSRFNAALEQFAIKQREFFKEQEWQRWANKTKKEELLAQVEALDNETDLQQVAATVMEAQRQWKKIGPVPREDSETIWERFRAACDRNFVRCKDYFDELDHQRHENQKQKEVLCEQAEALAESTDWKEAANEIKTLQEQWRQLGPALREQNHILNRRFRKACNSFFESRRKYFEEINEQRPENLAQKEELCRQAEAFAEDAQFQDSKKIRELQKQWKEIGPAPRELDQQIWQRFRGACDKFYGALDAKRQDNLKRKIALCDEVEGLLGQVTEDTNLDEVAHKITELQQQWKEIGPVPREDSDAVWERFRNSCDEFFESRRKHFEEADEQRKENEEKKQAILERAEQLASGEDSKEVSEQIQQLQKEWNEIGPAPRGREGEMRGRFQDICDAYFNRRRQFFEELGQERQENLKKKESLCFRLEKLLDIDTASRGEDGGYQTLTLADEFQLAREMTFVMGGQQVDRQRLTEEVRRIQEEWKTIGPVPRELDKDLRDRYRQLLDVYYGRQREGAAAPKRQKVETGEPSQAFDEETPSGGGSS